MTGQGNGGRRVIRRVTLITVLSLLVGAVISGSCSYRGSSLKEVTRIVEVTREVVVDRPIEVTRVMEITRVIEVTRIVEIVGAPSTQDYAPDQSAEGTASGTTGSVIIGIMLNDGRTATGTHTVALFPKTLINATGEAKPDRDQEIDIPVNSQTGFAEAYGLASGIYVACLKSLLHTATVGEIEVVADEITGVNLYWPADVSRINVECILDS